MDFHEQHVGQQVRDVRRIEMLPARQPLRRVDPLPVGEQAPRTRMKLRGVDVKRPEWLMILVSQNKENYPPYFHPRNIYFAPLRRMTRHAYEKDDRTMLKTNILGALALGCFLAVPPGAQAQDKPAPFDKKSYNYSEWTKGIFSEAVTVTSPGRLIFLAGVGSEDENGKGGAILHLGDFAGQCQYAYDKIKRLLAKQGAGMGDIAKIVTYVTDVRYQAEAGKCRREAFGDAPLPVHTFLNVSQLAWPGMLVEIDVTAVTAK